MIATARLTIRPYRDEDIAPTLAWLNDPALMRYSGQRHRIHTPETQGAYVNSFVWPNAYFAVEHQGALVGTATIYYDGGRADIGMLIGVPGRGYGSEVFGALLRHAFESTPAHKVTAGTLDVNVAMWRICERHGLRLEGRLRHHELVGGELMDLRLYGLLRAEVTA